MFVRSLPSAKTQIPWACALIPRSTLGLVFSFGLLESPSRALWVAVLILTSDELFSLREFFLS